MEDTERRFAELKQKFAPALRFLEDSRISVQNLQIQDNRLLIRVAVPAEAVRAQLMQKLEELDPALDEVHPDIRVENGDNVPNTGQTRVQSELEFSRESSKR